jgi:outer membrane receptor protein involved in Fe transport
MIARPAMRQIGILSRFFRENSSIEVRSFADGVLASAGWSLTSEYFQNVGSTRRQGIEAEVNLRSPTLQFYASYAFVDANFLNALQIKFNSPFADSDGNIQVPPGNHIRTILHHRIKAAIDDAMMELDKGADEGAIPTRSKSFGTETSDWIGKKLTKANCTKLPELFQPFEKKRKMR